MFECFYNSQRKDIYVCGHRDPTPRIQMLDGFNKAWIEFEGETRKGRLTLKIVLASMIDR